MKSLILLLIRAYQLTLSPFLGPCCRFYPSCSVYAAQAVERHGALKGSWLTLRRLARCHPWCEGFDDPVPPLDPPHDTSRKSKAKPTARHLHV